MELAQLLQEHRKRKGMTQEELAERSGVTVRTIQRIESAGTLPRAYTLKALAAALDLPLETLLPPTDLPAPEAAAPAEVAPEATTPAGPLADPEDVLHFLRLFCASCFSFLVIPWVHFLVPLALLRRRKDLPPPALRFARGVVRRQVYWVLATQAALLGTVAYNYIGAGRGRAPLPYLPTIFFLYLVNALLLVRALLVAGRVARR